MESIGYNVPYGIGKLYEKELISEGVFKTFQVTLSEDYSSSSESLSVVKEVEESEGQENSSEEEVSENKIDILINGKDQKK